MRRVRAALTREVLVKMPAMDGWPIEVSLEEVFRLQGGDPAVIQARRPALHALTTQAVAECRGLVEPYLAQRRLAVEAVEPDRVRLEGGLVLTGALLARRLAGAQAICAVICSAGSGVSSRATQEMARSKSAYGYALDCAATIVLENMVRRFFSDLETSAAQEGLKLSRRFSPGMRSWPVTQGQPEIFAILSSLNQGVVLTEGMQMLPVKSLSFVVGLGENLKRSGSECNDCSMRSRCAQRGRHLSR